MADSSPNTTIVVSSDDEERVVGCAGAAASAADDDDLPIRVPRTRPYHRSGRGCSVAKAAAADCDEPIIVSPERRQKPSNGTAGSSATSTAAAAAAVTTVITSSPDGPAHQAPIADAGASGTVRRAHNRKGKRKRAHEAVDEAADRAYALQRQKKGQTRNHHKKRPIAFRKPMVKETDEEMARRLQREEEERFAGGVATDMAAYAADLADAGRGRQINHNSRGREDSGVRRRALSGNSRSWAGRMLSAVGIGSLFSDTGFDPEWTPNGPDSPNSWRYAAAVHAASAIGAAAAASPQSPSYEPRSPSYDPPTPSYEALLALDDRIEKKGLSKEQLASRTMKQTLLKEDIERLSTKECVICLDEFKSRQVIRRLPCLCVYHAKCIEKHLRCSTKCPMCRADVR